MKTAEALDFLRSRLPGCALESTEFCDQITLEAQIADLKSVLTLLQENGYGVLMDLTGVDYVSPQKMTRVYYFLHNPVNLQRIRIVVSAAREVSIPTVTDIWEGARWYERELFDLFGVVFTGHVDLKRILMPDDWAGHPLRRDYELTEEPVEFKHGVKPKVPSKIIPYVQINKRS